MQILKNIRFIAVVVFVIAVLPTRAQFDNKNFSPEQYKASQEQFIAQAACLTPKESAKFFPLYNQMLAKQRAVFQRMKNVSFFKPTTEQGCLDAIKKVDQMQLDLRKIELEYHNKFLRVLPASKVYDVIQAENNFHRFMLKGMIHPSFGK